jgi:CDP-6-deoxy-D-xylo-4-hexulose-3-dehydrase
MDAVLDIVQDHGLFFIEDNCDALGSEYKGQKTGSFGHMSTCSFYPAHHITLGGEGGAVSTIHSSLYKPLKSIRDWGRDCWCDQSSPDGACGNRFNWTIDGVKYDHRYVYSHIGYNLKPTEMQAAFGLVQLYKLDRFVKKRKENYKYLLSRLKGYDEFAFPVPPKDSDPSWFCFPIRVTSNAKFTRNDITQHLESKGIQTRLLFAGNYRRQPAYRDTKMSVMGTENADIVMNTVFFIGVHPNLTKLQMDYVVKTIGEYI